MTSGLRRDSARIESAQGLALDPIRRVIDNE